MACRDPHDAPGPPPAADEAELLAALRAGNRAAAGELYRRHRSRAAAYLARRMVCLAIVEDVVQDTFLRLWDTAAGDAVGESDPATREFGAWLCGRVARRTLIDYGRKDRFGQLSALDIACEQARRRGRGTGRGMGRAALAEPQLDVAVEPALPQLEPIRDVTEPGRDRQTEPTPGTAAPGRWVA